MNKYFSIREYKAKNERKILFFFPAGFTQMWHYRLAVSSLNRMGITVVGFNFAWKKAIKECDFDDFVGLIKQVDRVVGEKISQKPKAEYAVLGLSFGSVLSLYTAKRHKNIGSIILFVPYGTLSHLFWTHKPSKPFIRTLAQNGISSERDLERLTLPIETQYQLAKLSGRKIVSFRGTNDKIVFDGEKLEQAMQKQKLNATFYTMGFGHFWTSVIGLVQMRKWTQILANEKHPR